MAKSKWVLCVLVIAALLLAGCVAGVSQHDEASAVDPGSERGAAGLVQPAAAASARPATQSLPGSVAFALTGAGVYGLLEADLRASAPAPRVPPLSPQALDATRAAIARVASPEALGKTVLGALVYEAESGEVLFEVEADRGLKPASNTKLFTTAAAFEILGPDYRFETQVFADGVIDSASETLRGDLVLLGQHDLTWNKGFYTSKDFVLDQLAAQVRAAGIRRVEGKLVVRGEFVYDGFPTAAYDPKDHRKAASEAFRKALTRAGVSVGGREERTGFDVPDGAQRVASWRSLPLSVAAVPINRASHNELADALVRHLGWVRRGESSYAAGTAEVVDWAASAGIDTTGLVLKDGSGLSHDNRVSARQLTRLVDHMLRSPTGRAWRRTLSVAGEYGTYVGRMKGPDTRGRVFAKSGTLNGVITTSGFLVNQYDGRTYIIALLMNETRGWASARTAQNRIIEALAGDLRGVGTARPAVPELLSLRSAGDGRGAQLRWQPLEGDIDGYWIWLSRDGVHFERRHYTVARGEARLRDLPRGERVYVRLTAVAASGAESDASDVFVARVSEVPSRVLVVDGNDRWQAEPSKENTLGAAHDFLVDYAAALGGVAFDSASDDAVELGLVSLEDYRAVIWAVGEQDAASCGEPALSERERQALERYLAAGGNLLLSGSQVASELSAAAQPEAQTFCSEHLRAACVEPNAHTTLVRGAGGIFADLPVMSFQTPGGMEVDAPDVLEPLPGAEPCLQYVGGGSGGAAAVQVEGHGYLLVHLGFPLESINCVADRAALMAAVLEFFEL